MCVRDQNHSLFLAEPGQKIPFGFVARFDPGRKIPLGFSAFAEKGKKIPLGFLARLDPGQKIPIGFSAFAVEEKEVSTLVDGFRSGAACAQNFPTNASSRFGLPIRYSRAQSETDPLEVEYHGNPASRRDAPRVCCRR
jgi:hypothetical protein